MIGGIISVVGLVLAFWFIFSVIDDMAKRQQRFNEAVVRDIAKLNYHIDRLERRIEDLREKKRLFPPEDY